MEKIDELLQPFALWLGLGLTKAAVVALIVALLVIIWNGTSDSGGLDD